MKKKLTFLVVFLLVLLSGKIFAQQYLVETNLEFTGRSETCHICPCTWRIVTTKRDRDYTGDLISDRNTYLIETGDFPDRLSLIKLEKHFRLINKDLANDGNVIALGTVDREGMNQILGYFYVNGPGNYPARSFGSNCRPETSINFSLNIYDAPNITGVSYNDSTLQATTCIANPTDMITFHLSAVNPGEQRLRIYANYYSDKDSILDSLKVVGSAELGTYAPTKTVQFSSLNLDKHYGKNIYFRISATHPDNLNGGSTSEERLEIYGNLTYPPDVFFRQIPTPASITPKDRKSVV